MAPKGREDEDIFSLSNIVLKCNSEMRIEVLNMILSFRDFQFDRFKVQVSHNYADIISAKLQIR